MNELKSHPHLLLKEHISQVQFAVEGIWQWHSEKLITEEIKKLTGMLIAIHDAGKGSEAFQKYIENPSAYKGDPLEKAHSPLSLVFTLLLLQKYEWNVLDTLIIAACACGHHSGLPCLPAKNFAEQESIDALDNFASGSIAKALKKQIASINVSLLEKTTGFQFSLLDLSPKCVRESEKYLQNKIMPKFYSMLDDGINRGLDFRLKAQLIFSFLLEADKAFLAVPDPKVYLERKQRQWKSEWIPQKIGKNKKGAVNHLRELARKEVLNTISKKHENTIYSMTAPTGIGKTLLAASWAFIKREEIQEKTGVAPKIIVVLPFLSIIDQTAKEYGKLLEISGEDADGSWFLTTHSLADRTYAHWLEEKAEYFFIDTWRSELIITTYDQFLMSLLEPRSKYQMRFHNLCDALIIMDEVQSMPCKLWQLLNAALQGLVRLGNTQILLMSATLPPFVSETLPLLEDYKKYFKEFSRYELQLQTQKKMPLENFYEDIGKRVPEWLKHKDRVLITLNTRKSARMVYDYLRDHCPDVDIPLLFISADVTPKDRLSKIEIIKEGTPCIVVSTQCIEAGVDIDMTHVIRDFAPWDSIVQIAGRCNREGKSDKRLAVEIYDLVNEKGRRYSEMIYDNISLQVTRNLIESFSVIKEENMLALSENYFKELDSRKDTGKEHLSRFVRWQDDIRVKEFLRGKHRQKYAFLVIEQDPELKHAMANTCRIDDRWERREAWRKIAGRIARISVEVYARSEFYPEDIADQFAGLWILKNGYYSSERGILLDKEICNSDGFTLIL